MTCNAEGPKAYGVRAETLRSVTSSCERYRSGHGQGSNGVTELTSIRMFETKLSRPKRRTSARNRKWRRRAHRLPAHRKRRSSGTRRWRARVFPSRPDASLSGPDHMIQYPGNNARLAISATSSAANQDCVICNSKGFGYGVFTRHRSADEGWSAACVEGALDRHHDANVAGPGCHQVQPRTDSRP